MKFSLFGLGKLFSVAILIRIPDFCIIQEHSGKIIYRCATDWFMAAIGSALTVTHALAKLQSFGQFYPSPSLLLSVERKAWLIFIQRRRFLKMQMCKKKRVVLHKLETYWEGFYLVKSLLVLISTVLLILFLFFVRILIGLSVFAQEYGLRFS